VATDASHRGLGGVLLQNNQPVLYVARSLTPAESRYAIIEKELLAVNFLLSRCLFYTYGRPVVVQTDHKPLLGLVHADTDRLSVRLRRLVERLYLYDLQWEYIPGKTNVFPDALSRLTFHSPPLTNELAEANLFQASDDRLLDGLLRGGNIFPLIAQTGADDVQFRALRSCVRDGWPDKLVKRDVRRHVLQPYWAQRHEIRELGPFLLYGSRVCVPRALHANALQLLHRGHPGINFMLQRARNVFYWPGITADIFRHVAACPECASTRPSLPSEPLLPTPPATYPGELLAADFFDYNGECYLACADAFSNYLFYCRVTSPSATVLIRACQQIFQHTGYPRVFASDGGPAFRAESFRDFLKASNCEHRVSSPRYAQSNGAAERAVQTLKSLRKKCATPDDLFRAVLLV
jgi:transposase InsO family protein